ncbi:MAG TPA: TolC family protein [Blastocatellia bacterium]|nr:TolC family protein [Blastocatellia bacterium]
MISVLIRFRKTGRAIAAASLATLIGASLPVATFAQEGIVAVKQQPSQQPKPPDTPPTPGQQQQKKDPPRPDTQRRREQQEQQGETRRQRPTERENRNLPPPGQTPAATPEATDPQQTTPGAPNPITQPLALSPEVTRQRVGVKEGVVETMSLQDAITRALQNNLDIEVFRQGVQAAQYNLFATRGVYDITSGSTLYYESRTFPVASIFAGGDASSSITQKEFNYDFTTSKLIERSGGLFQVDFLNNRLNTSATSSTLTTQYNPTLTLSFTQPLMRNLGIDQNRRITQLAKRSLDLSDSQFRQRVIEIINQVQRAYWDLVFAIRNEQIARDSVELTRVQLQNNQKMVEAGTLPPIDLRATEAALESRKGDVITALQAITTSENTLKGLLIKDANDKLWDAQIQPTDQPASDQPTVSLGEASQLALTNRPELEQMRLEAEQKQIDIKFFENQTKPQVDLVGFYSNTGLAGTPSEIVRGGGGFDTVTQGLITNLNRALVNLDLPTFNPIPPPESVLGASVPERFSGGYFRSLRNLFSQDFRTYQVGVRLSFPWRNRTAKGNLGRALAEARQLDARQRQLVQTVQIEVRNALQAVEAARQRFEAARAGRIAADAQYKGEVERYRAGLSTNFLVLEQENDLAIARGNEVRALTDYNKALADLQRVTGMTLVNNNVQVTARTDAIK